MDKQGTIIFMWDPVWIWVKICKYYPDYIITNSDEHNQIAEQWLWVISAILFQ